MRSLILLLAMSMPAAAANGPLTRAESSNYTATSTYADVMGFVRELQQKNSGIRVETLASSAEGREIPLLVIGAPAPVTPQAMRHDPRAVVYFQANIHGGEVEGKEAALMLARDLLDGDAARYLDKLVVLIAPLFNPDGNEKISTKNRPLQKGPVDGVGDRANGQNLDLNRDGIKLETPEVRGMVQNVLLRWDPVFFLDSHTHNGSYHEEPVTWVWGLNPNGDPAIFNYMANTVWPAIEKTMRVRFKTATIPHGDFLDPREPAKGWVPLGPESYYLSNYVGLRNRLSVLDEQYPYVDFETRVRGAHALMLSFLDFLAVNRDAVVALVDQADRKTIARGYHPTKDDVYVIDTRPERIKRLVTIHGYEMKVTDTGSRYPKVEPTEVTKTYTNIPYLAKYTPTRSVRLPRGYLINVPDPVLISKIREHGIAVEKLVKPATLEVEAFSVARLEGSPNSMQGHYTSTVHGSRQTKQLTFAAGSYFISMAQPLANVAAELLEPESPGGLVTWNFLDRHLAYQWMPRPMESPVYKLYNAANLATDSVP